MSFKKNEEFPQEVILGRTLLSKGITSQKQLEELFEPSFYAVIPLQILEDKSLSSTSKLLYGEITALTKKNGCCSATNKYLAERIGIKEDSIWNNLKQLKDKKYIKISIERSEKGTFRSISLHTPGGIQIHIPAVKKNTPKIDYNNKINKDILRISQKKKEKSSSGSAEINYLIMMFKEKTNLKRLGESEQKQRNFARHILKKYTMEQALEAIDWLLQDKFWNKQLTKISQLYYQIPRFLRDGNDVEIPSYAKR